MGVCRSHTITVSPVRTWARYLLRWALSSAIWARCMTTSDHNRSLRSTPLEDRQQVVEVVGPHAHVRIGLEPLGGPALVLREAAERLGRRGQDHPGGSVGSGDLLGFVVSEQPAAEPRILGEIG